MKQSVSFLVQATILCLSEKVGVEINSLWLGEATNNDQLVLMLTGPTGGGLLFWSNPGQFEHSFAFDRILKGGLKLYKAQERPAIPNIYGQKKRTVIIQFPFMINTSMSPRVLLALSSLVGME
ncbi:hypothetical protein PanWU01x14_009980 [Parasponia andersonii]|uniref:Uncharacterized protein n=1 Tax=Parasponia andersonii TaxID=3476 RepID=A0A2P5E2J8_PARAD|nr:hypothetical protein PanWU01x14_009980 [Parasponia andersonii]